MIKIRMQRVSNLCGLVLRDFEERHFIVSVSLVHYTRED